jgi:hypothetical protein
MKLVSLTVALDHTLGSTLGPLAARCRGHAYDAGEDHA